MADTTPQGDFPTVIGPDASFKGELSFEKGLRLQGRFEGKINSPGRLHVAREAKLQADVEGGAIILEGDVKGNLVANDRVDMKASARYEGDLRAAKLTVEEGAVFSGHVTVGPEAIKGGGARSAAQGAGAPRPGGAPQPQNQPVK
jgi:cytoskeletal protein CcmA (bactofilin family)